MDDNKENFSNFVKHERNKYIRFDEHGKKFIVNNPTGPDYSLPGLTKYLEKVFYPDYKYVRKSGDGSTGAGSAFGGIMRGKNVHDQLMHYSNMTKKEFQKKYESGELGNLEVYAAKAILAMKEWDFEPVIAEFCVWNKDIATRADNISRTPENEFVLIEWKTGMDSYFKRGNAKMHGVASPYTNCPMNQAFLQLLITKMIIEKEYKTKVHYQYVVNINKDGVFRYELPEGMLEHSSLIYDYFIGRVRALKKISYDNISNAKKKGKKRRKRTTQKRQANSNNNNNNNNNFKRRKT